MTGAKERNLALGVTATAGWGTVHRKVPRGCRSKKEEGFLQAEGITGHQQGGKVT